MKVTPLSIPDVLLIEPQVFGDDRGFFFESFNQERFEKAVGKKINFVQDNHSKSAKGVLRGLHYQLPPKAQGKFQWTDKWEHFRFLVTQVLQHELIHQHQCQFPEHAEGNYFDMNIDDKDIHYFSELDEIDAFGHDIAMEIRYYYPKEDPYQVLKTVSRRKYIHSYKYYTNTFKGLDWTCIRKRLIKKANNWIPFTHI